MKNTQQQFALIFTDPRNKQTKVNTQMQKGPAIKQEQVEKISVLRRTY